MNLVVGATGVVGGMVAEKLMERGEKVRALVRPESPGRAYVPHTEPDALKAKGAELVSGDLKDPSSLPGILEGVSRVVTTASATVRGGEDTIESVDDRGTGNLIEAAKRAGVAQFVYVSALGADVNSPGAVFQAKGENEQRLKGSGLNYTILQPVLFMENWVGALIGLQLQQGPKVQLIGEGKKKVAFIASEDVAELAVRVLGREEARNAVLPFSAEAATYREVIGKIEEATGMSIEVEVLQPGEQIMRLPPEVRPVLSNLMAGLALGPEMDIATPELGQRFGFELTSLEGFLKRSFA